MNFVRIKCLIPISEDRTSGLLTTAAGPSTFDLRRIVKIILVLSFYGRNPIRLLNAVSIRSLTSIRYQSVCQPLARFSSLIGLLFDRRAQSFDREISHLLQVLRYLLVMSSIILNLALDGRWFWRHLIVRLVLKLRLYHLNSLLYHLWLVWELVVHLRITWSKLWVSTLDHSWDLTHLLLVLIVILQVAWILLVLK